MKTAIAGLAVALMLFWGGRGEDLQSLLNARWFVCLLGCGLLLSWSVRRISWALVPCVLVTLFAGLSGTFLYDPYAGLPWAIQLAVKESAASSLLCFLLLSWTMLHLKEGALRALQTAFAWLGPVSAVLVLWTKASNYLHGLSPRSFIPYYDNPSLAGTVIAVAYPLMMREVYDKKLAWWLEWVVTGLSLAAVLAMGASTPMLAIYGMSLVVAVRNLLAGRREILWVVAFLIVLAGVACLVQPWSVWAHPSERFIIWGWGRDMMRGQPWQVQLFGLGLGSTHWILPLWQNKIGYRGAMYLTFHGDYVQFWVEQGLLGLMSALIVVGATIRRAWDTPWLLGATTAYAFSMLTNFTTHYALEAFMGFVLVRLAFSHWTDYPSLKREMHV